MTTGIFLSRGDLGKLSSAALAEVMGCVAPEPAAPGPNGSEKLDPQIARLSPLDARRFLKNCSSKTQDILRLIVSLDGHFYTYDIAQKLGTNAAGLRAVWAGLTKRTRTITGRAEALLISWEESAPGWKGTMASETVAAMRDALIDRD